MSARICRSAAIIGAAAALLVLVTRHAPGPVSAAMPQSSAPPTRIVLGWAGDAATSRAVTWRTRTPADSPRAEIGPASATGEGTAAPPDRESSAHGLEACGVTCRRATPNHLIHDLDHHGEALSTSPAAPHRAPPPRSRLMPTPDGVSGSHSWARGTRALTSAVDPTHTALQ